MMGPRTKKVLKELSDELLSMPIWKLRLRLFFAKYSKTYPTIVGIYNPDWKMPWDIKIVWFFRNLLAKFTR